MAVGGALGGGGGFVGVAVGLPAAAGWGGGAWTGVEQVSWARGWEVA